MPKHIAASAATRRSQTKIIGVSARRARVHRTAADPIIAVATTMPAVFRRAVMAAVRTVTHAAIRILVVNTIMRERLTDVAEHTLVLDLKRDTETHATALEVVRMLTAQHPTARVRVQVIAAAAAV